MTEDKKPKNSDGTTFVENLKGIKSKTNPPTHRAETDEAAKKTPGYKGKHVAGADVVDIKSKKDKK